MGRNVTRGLFRLWLVASVIWLTVQSVNIATLLIDPTFDAADTRQALLFGLIFAFGPPFALFISIGGALWVAQGFRRRRGDGATWPIGSDRAPAYTWSSGETARLYTYLDGPWADLVQEAARSTLTPSDGGVPVWDRSPAVHRAFERRLRTAVEDRLDAFWTDGVTDDEVAHVARDVGSLWRVNWPELATRLLAEQGNVASGRTLAHLNGAAPKTSASDGPGETKPPLPPTT